MEKNMYNPDRKKRFIKSYTTNLRTARSCESAFRAIGQFEEDRQADICTWSEEDIRPVTDQILGVRESSKWNRLCILKAYCKWCVGQGIEGATDAMQSIDGGSEEALKPKMVANPVHLQIYLDSVFAPESQQTISNTFRAYFWLAYSGMKEEEVLKVKASDVDLKAMTVTYGGVVFQLYKEGMDAVRNCVELSSFRYVHPMYEPKWIERAAANGELLRGFRGAPVYDVIRSQISRATTAAQAEGRTDMALSFSRAWLSGMFYRVYELERAGIDPDFAGIADMYMRGNTYTHYGKDNSKYKRMTLIRNYHKDYVRWKAAFDA